MATRRRRKSGRRDGRGHDATANRQATPTCPGLYTLTIAGLRREIPGDFAERRLYRTAADAMSAAIVYGINISKTVRDTSEVTTNH